MYLNEILSYNDIHSKNKISTRLILAFHHKYKLLVNVYL